MRSFRIKAVLAALVTLQLSCGMAMAQSRFPAIRPPTLPPINIRPIQPPRPPLIRPPVIRPPVIQPPAIRPPVIRPPTLPAVPPINLDPVGKQLDRWLKNAEAELRRLGHDADTARRLAERQLRRALWQNRSLVNTTKASLHRFTTQDVDGSTGLRRAILNRDIAAVLRVLEERASYFADAIESAKRENGYGSMIYVAIGDGGPLSVAIGCAIDLDALEYLIKHKTWPREVDVAIVALGGFTPFGLDGGFSGQVAIGYNVNDPRDLTGPSVDLNAEVSYTISGGVIISFDPTKRNVPLVQVLVGVGVGFSTEVSGGIGYTKVLLAKTSYTRPPANVRPVPRPPQTGPRPGQPYVKPRPTRPVFRSPGFRHRPNVTQPRRHSSVRR